MRRVLGLLVHGTFRSSGLGDHSFYSFSEDHLNVFRIENPSNKFEGMSEFGINISARILTPEQPSRILLRTPWEAIFEMIQRDPDAIYKFTKDPRSEYNSRGKRKFINPEFLTRIFQNIYAMEIVEIR